VTGQSHAVFGAWPPGAGPDAARPGASTADARSAGTDGKAPLMARPQRNDPNDKLTEAHQRLAQAVADLVSGDDWQAFLALAAKLHGYSARNVLLILTQAPWATQVAGYRTWQQLGRQVRAGQKGIAILAPCRHRTAGAENDSDSDTGDDTPGRPGRIVVRGFRVVHVFDISQTDGADLVEPAGPDLLHGDAPAGVWDALAALLDAEGYTLERGDCGGANGLTRFDARLVRIRSDVDDRQAAKSLAHEVAHVLLHDGSEYAAGCRGRAEVEAESVAYLICSLAGLDCDSYSFAYVAGWSGGDVNAVQGSAERVIDCARHIAQRVGAAAGLVAAGEPCA
jgi:N-terminal domain of anti-restriction factor ArdC